MTGRNCPEFVQAGDAPVHPAFLLGDEPNARVVQAPCPKAACCAFRPPASDASVGTLTSALSFLSFGGYPARMAVAVRSDDPAAFVAAVRDAVARGERLHLNVGDAECEITGQAAQGVLALLDVLASGADVDLTTLPAQLTTGQAADLLGVSRPTVVSLIDKGELAASRIGSHRRLQTADVLAYRERARRERSEALDEVVALSDELGLYDAE